MINPLIQVELAKIRQQELLKEAESWRLASLAMGENPGITGMIRQIVTNIVNRKINIHLFQHIKFWYYGRLSPLRKFHNS